jgi:hypothetical protein
MFVLFILGDIACTSYISWIIILVIAVPMSSLPRLNITLRQKVALSMVFGLGFFLIAVEIVRFRVIISAVTNIPHILVWNYISAWTSVVLASLPILRPLLFKRGYMSGRDARESMRIESPSVRLSMPVQPSSHFTEEGEYPLKGVSRMENEERVESSDATREIP